MVDLTGFGCFSASVNSEISIALLNAKLVPLTLIFTAVSAFAVARVAAFASSGIVVAASASFATMAASAPASGVPTEEELRKKLSPLAYSVTRERGTERPWTSELLSIKDKGVFKCACW